MQKKLRIILILLILCNTRGVFAQSVELDFPYFPNQEWSWTAFSGNAIDTLAVGTTDYKGQGHLVIPDDKKQYRGITRWLLNRGGGLDIVISEGKKEMSVSSSEAQPSDANIIFTNSSENKYFVDVRIKQDAMVNKVNAIYSMLQLYQDDKDLSQILNKELEKQISLYNSSMTEVEHNHSYAAHLVSIVNLSLNRPFRLQRNMLADYSQQDSLKNAYIVNKLDLNSLYTSGHWNTILSQWIEYYLYGTKHEHLLLDDYILLTKRISDPKVKSDFEKDIRAILHSKGLDELILLLEQAKAPALSKGKFNNKKTIVAFYDSGCGHCVAQMEELVQQYPELEKKGYDIISISADMSKDIFERGAEKFPWKQKLCDYKGLNGEDWTNYKVSGTPTLYLIDKGIIKVVAAQIDSLGL